MNNYQTKEQGFEKIDEKYQTLLLKKTEAKILAENELRDLEDMYTQKKIEVEEYFNALEKQSEILSIISNKPTI